MSISNLIVKLIGIGLAVFGFALIAACVGYPINNIQFLTYGVIGQFVMGVVLLGGGIYIVRGGTPSI